MTVAALRIATSDTARVYAGPDRLRPPGAYAAPIDPRRDLPSVERVLGALPDDLPHALRADAARAAIAEARDLVVLGRSITSDTVVADAATRLERARTGLLRPLVNATGVLLHTNLGRAPLGERVRTAMAAAGGYTNLEYRMEEGVRGSRHHHAGHLFALASGAEAGIVVNNNAAAVLLVLAALARDRDVVVSRGELVEIGGGFRVPEIMAETRARLVEVGTTNRTRVADYAHAIDDATALLLKVHASNYRMIGFVASVTVAELSALGPPVVVDAGSGLLDDTTPWLTERPHWLRDELGVRQCLERGAALVTFSGDKLLGGPQAGVIVGRRTLVERCAAHPLARVVRADKSTLAGLQEVALAYLDGSAASLPFWRMATVTPEVLRARAEKIVARVGAGPELSVIDTQAVAGGGSLPGLDIASVAVAQRTAAPGRDASSLRREGVVARIDGGHVVCDLRTVDPAEDDRLVAALRALTS